MRPLLVLPICAVFAAAGCGGYIAKQAAESTYHILVKSEVAARRQPDVELARLALPGAIMQLETFALAYPDHHEFKRLHTEALCRYAVAFVFDDWEDAQLRGRTAEAGALATRVRHLVAACTDANLALAPPAWRAARDKGQAAWRAVIATAPREQAPQLLWIAMADAVVLALDPMGNLGKLDAITAALQRCSAIEPGSHDSDAELLLGTLEAGVSRFLGGPDGGAWFARARTQLGDGALLVDVMYARGTLVAKQDRARFEATLRRVLAEDLARWPERRLANALAQRKAGRYLAAVDQLIPSKVDAPRD